ncbi:hypothetical protein QN277_007614 [Acacia crassicarpa]|uniref:Uncharacterized protein n=1 Tax=Acacia crassicarpa TaxID=499986 RepID=A0AAE1IWK9_9FABA|nr:hypothetical protein QN277_007614 [Acacia crassicarpa]
MVACTATPSDVSQHTMLIESWNSLMQAVDLVIGAITLDTNFPKSLWFYFLPTFQSHACSLSKLITWLNVTFIEHYTYFISDVFKWGLKMHKDFVDHGRLYVGALIIATVMLLFNEMADLSIISGMFLVHYQQQDLLLYSTWAYVMVENAGSTNCVEIIIAAAILIVVLASCVLVMLYKLMSFWFAEVLVVLFCIDGIEGLQTCLVAIWNSLDSSTWQFLDCFISSFPNLDLEDKVNFPGGSNVMNPDEMGLTEDDPMGTWVGNEERSIRRSKRSQRIEGPGSIKKCIRNSINKTKVVMKRRGIICGICLSLYLWSPPPPSPPPLF